MGQLPTLRWCVSAAAGLLVLAAVLFIGAENPTALRMWFVVCAFFMAFPADKLLRLAHLVRDKRPESKDFLFAAAIDPAEGHVEPEDYTLIGVITEVRNLDPTAAP